MEFPFAASLVTTYTVVAVWFIWVFWRTRRWRQLPRKERLELRQQMTLLQRTLLLYGFYMPPQVRLREDPLAIVYRTRAAFEQLAGLLSQMQAATQSGTAEMQHIAERVEEMAQREQELAQRIEVLEKQTPEAAKVFAELVAKSQEPYHRQSLYALIVTFVIGMAVTLTLQLVF